MSFVAVASLIIRTLAFVISLTFLARPRDWRFAVLGGWIAFLIAGQVIKLDLGGDPWMLTWQASGQEWRGLIVSLFAFAAVFFLRQILMEHKATQAELVRSGQRFEDFLEASVDRYWEMDRTLRFTRASDPTGHSHFPAVDSTLGKTRWDLVGVDPDKDEKWQRHRADLEAHRPFRDFRFFCRDADGRVGHWRVSGKPVFDPEGRFQGYLGTSTNETEAVERRERAEKALLESERKYQDLYEYAPAMFASVDAATRRVIECNRTYLETTGFAKEEVIGKDLFQLYHSDCADEVADAFRTFLETGQVKNEELQLRRKDGGKIDVGLDVSAVRDDGGAILYSRSMWRDVTAQKRAEEARRRHDSELAQVLRRSTMDEMAATLAHELNQPLGAVVNFAKGGLRKIDAGRLGDGDIRAVMERVCAEAERASAVLRNVGRFVAQMPPNKDSFDMNEVIRSASALVEPELREAGIEIHLNVGAGPLEVTGNKIELEQVFLNLIRNAIEALRGTAEDCREIRVRAASVDAAAVDVSVEDSGPGLSEAAGTCPFEPFVTTKADGMGMGLAISRRIVEAHGGRIMLENGVAGGARARISLPIAEECIVHVA